MDKLLLVLPGLGAGTPALKIAYSEGGTARTTDELEEQRGSPKCQEWGTGYWQCSERRVEEH